MANEEHVTILRVYAERLKKWSKERCPPDFNGVPGMGRQLKHANWMIHEALRAIEEDRADAAEIARWAGFIQGVVWGAGLHTFAEMEEHGAPPPGPCEDV